MFDLFGNSAIETDALGIPYMGSKRKYADRLICKMLEQSRTANTFMICLAAVVLCHLRHYKKA